MGLGKQYKWLMKLNVNLEQANKENKFGKIYS